MFLDLPESTQCILIERLEEILLKCAHNALILTDHIVLTNVSRVNNQIIKTIATKSQKN
jgi:hypothetical protein